MCANIKSHFAVLTDVEPIFATTKKQTNNPTPNSIMFTFVQSAIYIYVLLFREPFFFRPIQYKYDFYVNISTGNQSDSWFNCETIFSFVHKQYPTYQVTCICFYDSFLWSCSYLHTKIFFNLDWIALWIRNLQKKNCFLFNFSAVDLTIDDKILTIHKVVVWNGIQYDSDIKQSTI